MIPPDELKRMRIREQEAGYCSTDERGMPPMHYESELCSCESLSLLDEIDRLNELCKEAERLAEGLSKISAIDISSEDPNVLWLNSWRNATKRYAEMLVADYRKSLEEK